MLGYALGGGLSWMVRRYGLACNSITAADVVTADGRLIRTDRDTEPELFWALRGGGGNVAAVTAIELELVPVPEIYAGALFWPIERAAETAVGPIVTTVEPMTEWYPAEGYHQDYWETSGRSNPYCMAVIPPKLQKLRKSFAERSKAVTA